MNYGRAIRTCRAALGIQQKDLAKLSGTTASRLSLIEAGKRTPSVGVVESICEALGVPVHLLLLLATDARGLDQRPREEVSQLARSLLELLVSDETAGRQ